MIMFFTDYQSIFYTSMANIRKIFAEHLIFRQARGRRYGVFQEYTDAQKASVQSFIQGLPGTARDNILKRKMHRMIQNRPPRFQDGARAEQEQDLPTRAERDILKSQMINIQDPEAFDAIRKMMVHIFSPWGNPRYSGDWRYTEYHNWRNSITERYFNKRPIHKSRNPLKAKNKDKYHTDVKCCRRRIKKVEEELRNTMAETIHVLDQRKQLENELYELRNDFQHNLQHILENEGIVGVEQSHGDMRTRSIQIIIQLGYCDDKLSRSFQMSCDMSNELVELRLIEWGHTMTE